MKGLKLGAILIGGFVAFEVLRGGSASASVSANAAKPANNIAKKAPVTISKQSGISMVQGRTSNGATSASALAPQVKTARPFTTSQPKNGPSSIHPVNSLDMLTAGAKNKAIAVAQKHTLPKAAPAPTAQHVFRGAAPIKKAGMR